MMYAGSIDYRFSYVYGADFNRDGFSGNDLIYIPKDPSEISFVDLPAGASTSQVAYSANEQSALFFKYIDQDKYLKAIEDNMLKEMAPRHHGETRLILSSSRISLLILVKTRIRFNLPLDIFNIGNLINKNWSKVET